MISPILITLSLSLILYAIYALIFRPWSKIQIYSQQGCKMKFFPILGNYNACLDGLKSHGDFYINFKQQLKQNPQLKGIGGNLLDKAQVYLTDPDAIGEFYKQQDKYTKATTGLDLFKVFLGEGLVTTEGEVWKRHRKIIASSFHYEFLKKIIPDVGTIAHQLLENLKQNDLQDVGAIQAFETITGEVVGRLFFGTKFSDYRVCGMPVTALVTSVGSRIGSELFSIPYLLFGARAIRWGILPRYKKLMEDIQELNMFAKSIIEPRMEVLKAAKENGDVDKMSAETLIDSLILSSDFTTQEIIDEFVTFFAAGMDTTGHMIAMAVYYLSQNPQFKAKLIEEAEKYIGEPSQITIESLNEMEFTTAFFKETLRFALPAGVLIDRVALQDHELNGLKIKKGTLVNVCLIGNNFNPEYHDKENEFDPERWITDSKTKRSVAKNSRIFLPFSAGAHNCIGQHLAMNEAKIIFSMFLKKFDFELSSSYEHKMTLRLVHEPANRLSFKLISK